MRSGRTRGLALIVVVIGLALCAYVEWALTHSDAPDRFGWFVYESVAWLALISIGPLLPLTISMLAAALLAFAIETFAYWLVFAGPGSLEHAAIYFWKPLLQLAAIAVTWLAGYLVYLRTQREARDG
jgi:hypothetical protein